MAFKKLGDIANTVVEKLKPIKIGFTGTSEGIPEPQLLAAMKLLIKGAELHFGDCVGADAQAWYLATAWGFRTVAHPPIDPKKRAFCKADEIRAPKPYIERNHDIVDECERLIATPRTMEEELRSGTWATIRYARKLKKPVIIVTPNGALYGALYG